MHCCSIIAAYSAKKGISVEIAAVSESTWFRLTAAYKFDCMGIALLSMCLPMFELLDDSLLERVLLKMNKYVGSMIAEQQSGSESDLGL